MLKVKQIWRPTTVRVTARLHEGQHGREFKQLVVLVRRQQHKKSLKKAIQGLARSDPDLTDKSGRLLATKSDRAQKAGISKSSKMMVSKYVQRKIALSKGS